MQTLAHPSSPEAPDTWSYGVLGDHLFRDKTHPLARLLGWWSRHTSPPDARAGASFAQRDLVRRAWIALFGAAALSGGGFGAYLGIDINLAVRVLPRAEERGKDLGVMYTSIFLPLILSPLIGAVALNVFHSFALLFAVAALASSAAAGLIMPIRAVR